MGWISVKDKLPMLERVLVNTTTCGRMVASRGGRYDQEIGDFAEGWVWGCVNDVDFSQDEVTHWQPLPKPPTNK